MRRRFNVTMGGDRRGLMPARLPPFGSQVLATIDPILARFDLTRAGLNRHVSAHAKLIPVKKSGVKTCA
jgi:hypothetical protein